MSARIFLLVALAIFATAPAHAEPRHPMFPNSKLPPGCRGAPFSNKPTAMLEGLPTNQCPLTVYRMYHTEVSVMWEHQLAKPLSQWFDGALRVILPSQKEVQATSTKAFLSFFSANKGSCIVMGYQLESQIGFLCNAVVNSKPVRAYYRAKAFPGDDYDFALMYGIFDGRPLAGDALATHAQELGSFAHEPD